MVKILIFGILFSMKFRRYKKIMVSDMLSRGIILIIMSVLSSFIILKFLSVRANTVLLPMAEGKLKKIVSTLINASTNNLEFDKNLFSVVREDGEITMVNYNSYEVTRLINEVTSNIEGELDKLNSGDDSYLDKYTIEMVPIGVIFNNSFLRGLGPKIPLKAEMVSSIVSNIETEVKPYGINNAYVETRIFLEVTAVIYLPFVSKEVKISNVIPIVINILQGSVPNGYITSYK